MFPQQSFGYWLKLKRKSLDLTREGLAERVGCSAATVRKLEAEERRPSEQIAERLAEVFQIPKNERDKFLRFARGEITHAPSESAEEIPWQRTNISARSNVPAPVTSLIGREKEITDLHERLSKTDTRLITLIGPPGIGKTRLSIEATREILSIFPDGIFFIALAPLDDASHIAPTIVQTLGYMDKRNRPALEMLKEGIVDKRILLILDNCEHLIEDIAPLASGLLSACPRLKILATSRESLRVPGEWLYLIPALDIPKENSSVDIHNAVQFPALALFTERAQAVRPDFSLNPENVQAVASICSQLDGLPLAIELIASRIRLTSPQSLLERMSGQFVLSADGMRAVSARQKTLKNAIQWSYDFLPLDEQKIFAYLSVFSGGFTLDAAEAIFSGMNTDKPVSEIVTSLFDKSLLLRSTDIQGNIRFHMLFAIQQFALAHLNRIGNEQEIHKLHISYFLNFAIHANQEIHGPNQIKHINQLEKDHGNFRSALEWCLSYKDTQSALQLISALSWYWGLWLHNSEIRGWFDKLRSLPDIHGHPLLYAQLLNHIGHSNWLAGDFQNARAILEESRSIWNGLGTVGQSGTAETLCYLGMIAHSIDSDYETAKTLFEQSLDIYKRCDNQWGMALALFNLGWVDDHRDKDETAQKYLEQSWEIFSRLGDLWGIGRSSQFLGQLFLKQGRHELAARYFKQHLSIDENLQFKPGIVVALGNLGDLYRHQGDYEQAEQFYLRNLAICREYGLKIDRGYGLFALGMLGLQKKDYPFATQYVRQYFESGSRVSRILATCDLCLGMSAAAGGMHEPERSAKLYGAAQALLQVIDIPYTPFDRKIFDQHIQIARASLGEKKFEELSADGRAMTVDEAIDLALRER